MFNLKRIICFIFGHKNWYETNDPDIESGCFYCGYSTLKRKPKENIGEYLITPYKKGWALIERRFISIPKRKPKEIKKPFKKGGKR